MKRRTDKRKARVLAAIQITAKTVREVQQECGITYMNAYYTLTNLRDEKKAHIVRWSVDHGHKPMAVFIAGEGYDAILGGDVGRTKEEVLSADRALRAAVSLWVAERKDDDQEQQSEA